MKKYFAIIFLCLYLAIVFNVVSNGEGIKKRPSDSSGNDTTASYIITDRYFCGSQYATSAKPFYAAADLQTALNDAATDGKRWVKVTSSITLDSYLILKNNVNIDAEGDTLICGVSDDNVAVVCVVKAAAIIGVTGSPGNSGVYTQNLNSNITVYADCVGQSTGGDSYSGSGAYAKKGTITVYGDCFGNYRHGIATNYQGIIYLYGNCTCTGTSSGYGAEAYGGEIYVTGSCIATGTSSCDGARTSIGSGGGIITVKGDCITTCSSTAGIGAYSSGGTLTVYGSCIAGSAAKSIGAGSSNAATCTLKVYGGVISGKEYGAYCSAGYMYLEDCLIKSLDASSAYSAIKLAQGGQTVLKNCVLTNQHAEGISVFAADSEDVYILGTVQANRVVGDSVYQKIGFITVNDTIPTFP